MFYFKNLNARVSERVDGDMCGRSDVWQPEQVHGDGIFVVEGGEPRVVPGVDALITEQKGRTLMVRFADCQGVLISGPGVVAAVHAGWKGNSVNIIGKTVAKMRDEFGADPAKMMIAIPPSLGPCCSEFSDPYTELPPFMHDYIFDGNKVNLWRCALDQLHMEGVPAENIELSGICTACNVDRFFSYRAENGKTGRMGGFIKL